jgi:hypothetical protein
MSVFIAMGVPTTTDDRGYLLWLSHNWPIFLLPALALVTLLTAWLARKPHTWTKATPGGSEPPNAQTQNMSGPDQPNLPSGPDCRSGSQGAFGIQPQRA